MESSPSLVAAAAAAAALVATALWLTPRTDGADDADDAAAPADTTSTSPKHQDSIHNDDAARASNEPDHAIAVSHEGEPSLEPSSIPRRTSVLIDLSLDDEVVPTASMSPSVRALASDSPRRSRRAYCTFIQNVTTRREMELSAETQTHVFLAKKFFETVRASDTSRTTQDANECNRVQQHYDKVFEYIERDDGSQRTLAASRLVWHRSTPLRLSDFTARVLLARGGFGEVGTLSLHQPRRRYCRSAYPIA